MRRYGDITADLEPLLEEMVDDHDMQVGEILYQIWGWLVVHRPESVEQYIEDGSSPVIYGPRKNND